MRCFLVGGAVRDKLLNYPTQERDWVVVGATEAEMLKNGFKSVGKDFPVFLHPKSKEEYALARTERKIAKGYAGFEFNTHSNISLEQDLSRRDLTINAMAMDEQGEIIDPYNGQADLQNKILRHVSAAFNEDPLRVIRVARFAARYHHLGFSIAPETQQLMQQLSQSDELQALSAERIWKETQRALTEADPQIYFLTLKNCGALSYWFKEIEQLWGIPNPQQWHPEIDSGIHTMLALQQAVKLSEQAIVRFAVVCHDLGKIKTPAEKLPSHPGHEKAGLELIDKLCDRIKAPNDYRQLAKITSEFHLHVHNARQLKATTIVKLFQNTDAFRKPERFAQFLLACEADARGREGFENRDYPQADLIRECLAVCNRVDTQVLIKKGYQGKKLGEEIYRLRVERVKTLQKDA